MKPKGTPTIYNITCTLANTEYSQVINTNLMFEVQARTDAVVRLAFETGKVATPTAPFLTLMAGDFYYNDNSAATILYVASPTAGTVVELMVWS